MLKLVGFLGLKIKLQDLYTVQQNFLEQRELTKQHFKHISVNQIQEPTGMLSWADFNFN